MKIFLVTFLALVTARQAVAAFNEPLVIKKISDDGSSFVFARKDGPPPWNGITIKDPQTKATLYEARVLKCSATSCLGQIVKNPSGITFREDEEYLHSYNDKPIVYEAKPVAEVKPVEQPKPEVKAPEPAPVPVAPKKVEPKPEPNPEPKPEPKVDEAPKERNRSIYLAYGSPLGPGIKLGYLKKYEKFWLGFHYANISSSTNDVSLKGHLASGLAMYNAFKPTTSTDINLLMELGVAKATLDFSGVDSADGPSQDETTYFLALGGEGRLNFEKFSLAARMGMSKSGLAQDYDGQQNRYNNPYGTILVFVELGLYYHF